jgi:hypothetical protein
MRYDSTQLPALDHRRQNHNALSISVFNSINELLGFVANLLRAEK